MGAIIIFLAGFYVGQFRWMGLSSFVELNQTFMRLKQLESNEDGELINSLNLDIDSKIVEISNLNKLWLVPVDSKGIQDTFSRIAEYRKNSNYKYDKNTPFTIIHEEAEKILSEQSI